MQIEIVDVNSNGDGYCVVHRKDGSTFGQHFYGMPLDSSDVLLKALADFVLDKVNAAPIVGKSKVAVPSDIKKLLNVKQTV